MLQKEYVRIAIIVRNVREVVVNVWTKYIYQEKMASDKIIIVCTWFIIMFVGTCMLMQLKLEIVLGL